MLPGRPNGHTGWITARSATLLRVGSPEVAVRACAAVAALGRNLRRIGADGDGLVWIPGCDSLPVAALVPLISGGGPVGLPVLMTTTSAAVARELAGRVGVLLIYRLADATAAADLVGLGAPLGAGEFVLAVNAPRRRRVALGRLVPARLPRPVARQEGTWRRLRYDAA